ncbi:cytochrome P450 [Streptomyces sp. NPDC087844]|uniref:cytochrome P450 family protein n=1 Tax=Streptomyces sp. NPDC087844 TaxID=3365805 RepID=UPI00382097C5
MTADAVSAGRTGPPARQRLWDGGTAWIVTRYDEVRAVLGDPRFVANTASLPGAGGDAHADLLVKVGIEKDLAPYLAGGLLHLDPPDHTRLRLLVSRALSAERVVKLRPRVRDIADELLDALPGHAVDGTVDLVEHFALPLPFTVLCELLGVPELDRPLWRAWIGDCTGGSPRTVNTALAEYGAAVRELAARRRTEPGDDLVTALVRARDKDGDRLTDTELVTVVLTLMVAGHETTAHLIANGAAALLTHPGQLALLRDDLTLMPGAVQELLRLHSPATTAQLRHAAEDVVLGDTLIRRGDRVQADLDAAGLDPRRCPWPGRFDIGRDPRPAPHLGYSHGPHRCLGAALADQETEIALTGLLTRFPDLALAVPAGQLSWVTQPLRRLTRLPLSLGKPG